MVVELARWTHLWLEAAVITLDHLESSWEEERPASSVARRDALSLVLVDAVRNVYRGASAILGVEARAVRVFEEGAAGMKDLRDRLEHFDAYLTGRGFAQTGGPRRPPIDLAEAIGLQLTMSEGGGPGGHTINVVVAGADENEHYVFETRSVVEAARRLAGEALVAAGLMTEDHSRLCSTCKHESSDTGDEDA